MKKLMISALLFSMVFGGAYAQKKTEAHGYPINHFFLMGGSVMSIDVVPLEVDLSKELNEDEKKEEVIGLVSDLFKYVAFLFLSRFRTH